MEKFGRTKIKTNGKTRVTLDLRDFLIKQFDISAWRNLESISNKLVYWWCKTNLINDVITQSSLLNYSKFWWKKFQSEK